MVATKYDGSRLRQDLDQQRLQNKTMITTANPKVDEMRAAVAVLFFFCWEKAILFWPSPPSPDPLAGSTSCIRLEKVSDTGSLMGLVHPKNWLAFSGGCSLFLLLSPHRRRSLIHDH
ncbi:hypothetical protein MUCCIDRAFT_107602 [Mucor lusitanicus CBS 277.49]|uniref:Uncharacterized protein n=1 Tax=Mucor lusitanicus CBS 277.49 TaxID=747725 RepID=A0A168P0Z2_MUCCL|nr:hypothetical protein MUCCIDRAFT_107602 [Mucor lusitanicus CBS 277.49]